MKKFRRLLALALCAVTLASAAGVPSASAADGAELQLLSVTRNRITDERGRRVVLRGVNLGSWLMQEYWMTPVKGSGDAWTTLSTLVSRFGADGAAELTDIYQDNFITERDFERIAEMGFNCVRIPFWYRNFYSDDDGGRILDSEGNWDFSRLIWAVEQCGKNGLYAILDLHGAPGFQSQASHSGRNRSCMLYEDSERGRRFRELTVELWAETARVFKGNKTVAMYDLLNEPMCDMPEDEKDDPTLWALYDRIYDAVRARDGEHIITLEGIWRLSNLPDPKLYGWDNVVYQLHLYDTDDSAFAFNSLSSKYIPIHGVPCYIGEFRPNGTATWQGVLSSFTWNDVSWSMWSYKGMGGGADTSDWFLFGKGDAVPVNIKTDSFETIAAKWGEPCRTEAFADTGLLGVFEPYLDGRLGVGEGIMTFFRMCVWFVALVFGRRFIYL